MVCSITSVSAATIGSTDHKSPLVGRAAAQVADDDVLVASWPASSAEIVRVPSFPMAASVAKARVRGRASAAHVNHTAGQTWAPPVVTLVVSNVALQNRTWPNRPRPPGIQRYLQANHSFSQRIRPALHTRGSLVRNQPRPYGKAPRKSRGLRMFGSRPSRHGGPRSAAGARWCPFRGQKTCDFWGTSR
jgi:hypothetical protein